MFKRVLSMVLAISMVMALFCSVGLAAGTTTISSSAVSGNAGDIITVPVNITNNTEGICGYTIEIAYDADYLTPISEENGGFVVGNINPGISQYNAANAAGITTASCIGFGNVTGDGTLFSVKFTVNTSIITKDKTTVGITVKKLSYINAEGKSTNRNFVKGDDAIVTINPNVTIPVDFEIDTTPVTYNGTIHKPQITATVNGQPYTGQYVVTYNSSSIPPQDASTYEVYVAVSAADREKGYEGKQTASFTIKPAPIYVSANPNQSKLVGEPDPTVYEYTHDTSRGDFYLATEQFSGSLTRDAGETVGTYTIRQGSLSVPSNYVLYFTEATFTINDKLTQNVVLAELPASVKYGDAPFSFAATPDASVTVAPQYASSNTDVATIAADGTVTIVGAGTTELTVTVDVDDASDYADFTDGKTLTVNPIAITIEADDKTAKVGTAEKELTYTITPADAIINGDLPTGALTREPGTEVGTYAITQGTLSYGNNYAITFIPGVYEIVSKNTQNVVLAELPASVKYGDASFSFAAIPDANVAAEPQYASSNTDVATIAADGTVTIVGAGTTELTVTVDVDDASDYADFTDGKTLTVNPIAITIEADDKTAKVGTAEKELTYTITPTDAIINGDLPTGALTREPGTEVGTYAITQGTLSYGNNYAITFIPGVYEIVSKNIQNVVLAELPASVKYGDASFSFAATPDANVAAEPQYASSNTDVATIAADGTVTIVGAGTTELTVTVDVDDASDYADFTDGKTLVVASRPVEISMNPGSKYVGQPDSDVNLVEHWKVPEGSFVGDDEALISFTREEGEEVGLYDILVVFAGNTNNYTFTFADNIHQFEILAKLDQTLTVGTNNADSIYTYGDDYIEALKIIATADSGLADFTYATSDDKIAVVDEDGNITIKAAGKVTLTINQSGNYMYNAKSASIELDIKAKPITLVAVDLANKTVVFGPGNIEEGDEVSIDFDKLNKQINVETQTATVTNFVLTGADKDNYKLETQTLENVPVVVTTVDESKKAEALPDNVTADIKRVEGTDVVVISTIDTTAVTDGRVLLDMTKIDTNRIANVQIPKTAFADLKNKEGVSLAITLTDAVVEFSKEILALIDQDAIDNTLSDINLEVNKRNINELNGEQQTSVDNNLPLAAQNKQAIDVKLNGGGIDFGANVAKIKVAYTKGDGVVKAKYISADGTVTEDVSVKYDGTHATLEVSHFSDYVLYTAPASQGVGFGGGGATATYTVKFESNGGSLVDRVYAAKNTVIKEPKAPVKEGFVFEGWYSDIALTQKYDFATKIANSITLYAKWIEEKKDDEPEVEPGTAKKFADVNEDDWYYDTVMAAVEKGLMVGTSDEMFSPDEKVTRGMFVTVLHRLSGDTKDTKDIAFADVNADDYYASAVAWAKRNAIVSGVTENEFAPAQEVTREQMAAMLYRYAEYKGMDTTIAGGIVEYADSGEISDYAKYAVIWANKLGIMKGNADGTFAPIDSATRAELATVFVRALEMLK